MTVLDENLERLRKKVDGRIERLLVQRSASNQTIPDGAFDRTAFTLADMPEPLAIPAKEVVPEAQQTVASEATSQTQKMTIDRHSDRVSERERSAGEEPLQAKSNLLGMMSEWEAQPSPAKAAASSDIRRPDGPLPVNSSLATAATQNASAPRQTAGPRQSFFKRILSTFGWT